MIPVIGLWSRFLVLKTNYTTANDRIVFSHLNIYQNIRFLLNKKTWCCSNTNVQGWNIRFSINGRHVPTHNKWCICCWAQKHKTYSLTITILSKLKHIVFFCEMAYQDRKSLYLMCFFSNIAKSFKIVIRILEFWREIICYDVYFFTKWKNKILYFFFSNN